MLFINADYFALDLGEKQFDAIITDIPYKGSQKGRYHEEDFSFDAFFRKTFKECKESAVLITFSNDKCENDLRLFCESSGWHYAHQNVWFKPWVHNFVSPNAPLKNCEYILYFYKGDGLRMLNFRNGARYLMDKPRKSSLYTDRPCKNKYGYGQYQAVLQLSVFPQMKKYGKAKRASKPRFPNFPPGWKRCKVWVGKTQKCFAPEKPIGFSWYFWNILMGEKWDTRCHDENGEAIEQRLPRLRNLKVLDPFCGSAALLAAFNDGIGVDISTEQIIAAKGLNGVDGVDIIYHPDYPMMESPISLDETELEDEIEDECESELFPNSRQSRLI